MYQEYQKLKKQVISAQKQYEEASNKYKELKDSKAGEKNEIEISQYFNFTAGGNIPIKNTLISVQPSLQVMTDFVAWRADITARGPYDYDNKQFFGGLTYSPDVSVTFFVGMEMMNITASYGYELFTSGIGAANGSHDIFLGYQINLDIFKKEKNKHNSIRILQ